MRKICSGNRDHFIILSTICSISSGCVKSGLTTQAYRSHASEVAIRDAYVRRRWSKILGCVPPADLRFIAFSLLQHIVSLSDAFAVPGIDGTRPLVAR